MVLCAGRHSAHCPPLHDDFHRRRGVVVIMVVLGAQHDPGPGRDQGAGGWDRCGRGLGADADQNSGSHLGREDR